MFFESAKMRSWLSKGDSSLREVIFHVFLWTTESKSRNDTNFSRLKNACFTPEFPSTFTLVCHIYLRLSGFKLYSYAPDRCLQYEQILVKKIHFTYLSHVLKIVHLRIVMMSAVFAVVAKIYWKKRIRIKIGYLLPWSDDSCANDQK